MRKLLCVIGSLSGGGAEHQMIELCKLLQLKDYEITIATFIDEIDFYELPPNVCRIRVCEHKSNWRKVLGLMYLCRTNDADAIISFSQRTSCFVLASQIFSSGRKVIASERNLTVGGSSIYEKILFNFLYKRANFIVPNSYAQRDYIISKNKSLSSKVVTITNYTDLSLYMPAKSPINKILHIGIFGRYNEQKNYKRFAEALSLLRTKTDIPFIVEWYGDITFMGKENPDYLEFVRVVSEYKIQDVIKLYDHVKNVSELIPKYDVMCLPSIYEGFSNSLSEYICCGKPVLASDVSDNHLMVEDGVNGFLFNPLSPEDISNSFIKFFELSNEEKAQMGRNSREKAEVLFNAESFAQKYIELIEAPK